MPRWSPFDPALDHRLVRELNEGEDGALGRLYDRYAERLYDYTLSIVQDPPGAADIVHDTFIDAFRRAPRMRDREHLRPWLYAAVRRRCLLRAHGDTLIWDWDAETGTPLDPYTGLPYDQLHDLVEAVLARLDFADQEALLLSLRHGLTARDVAATLGTGRRRAGRRVAAARSRLIAAVTAESRVRSARCADRPDQGAEPEISATALLSLPPCPELPAALRRRVMHTATDSELSGYRADIAARGGHLTSAGLPRQPDVASPLVRRWAFTGGGALGLLAAAAAVVLVLNPGLPIPHIDWFDRNPPHSPASPGSPVPTPPTERRSGVPAARGPEEAAPPVTDPLGETPMPTLTSSPSTPAPRPTRPGLLKVGPDKIAMGTGQAAAVVKLTAFSGEVAWSAASSSDQLLLSAEEGTIPVGTTQEITITLRYGKLTFPGMGTITFSTLTRGPSGDNVVHDLTVSWKGASLL